MIFLTAIIIIKKKTEQTDILYLGFAKAFDSVDHAILLEKLERDGVAEHLHDWFKNYLQDRQ